MGQHIHLVQDGVRSTRDQWNLCDRLDTPLGRHEKYDQFPGVGGIADVEHRHPIVAIPRQSLPPVGAIDGHFASCDYTRHTRKLTGS